MTKDEILGFINECDDEETLHAIAESVSNRIDDIIDDDEDEDDDDDDEEGATQS